MTGLWRLVGALLVGRAGASAGWANPTTTRTKPHHTPTGFRNNHIGTVNKPLATCCAGANEAIRDGPPKPPGSPTPVVAPDLAAIQANARAGAAMVPAVTWIGHATALVQASGLNVLTDPIFSERARRCRSSGRSGPSRPACRWPTCRPLTWWWSAQPLRPPDRQSVVDLNHRSQGATLFLVPLGLKPWLEKSGHHPCGGAGLVGAPPAPGVDFSPHAGAALVGAQPGDRSQTLWVAGPHSGPGFSWYHSGDTGYSPDFAETRRFLDSRHPQA